MLRPWPLFRLEIAKRKENIFPSQTLSAKGGVHRGHHFSAARFKQIESMMRTDSEDKTMLLDRFSEVKRLRDTIVAVGFDKHPIFSDIFTLDNHGSWTKRVNGFVWDYFERLVYRKEISLKFQNMVYSNNSASVHTTERCKTLVEQFHRSV